MKIVGYADIAKFSARVESWLARREAEHNLLLSLLPRLLAGGHGFEPPIYLASIEDRGEVAGCAFRTPPFKLGITRMPMAAIGSLVDHVAGVYAKLPAILGPEDEVLRFAELWSRSSGCVASAGMRQRIHALECVIMPEASPNGALRPAVTADLPLLVDWMAAFATDTGTAVGDQSARAEELLRDGAIFVWEDGELRSMVAAAGTTPRGNRIGYVYTPPPFRGRGYATSAVATLSERLLREGRRVCFLYTDLANPTSNAIYARIGYAPVCDVINVDFSC